MLKPRFTFYDLVQSLLIPNPKKEEHKDIPIPGAVLEPKEAEEAPEGLIWVDLKGKPRTKDRGKSKGRRAWKNIKGITLHQTAVDFGTNAERLLNVPAHSSTLRDGQIVLLHDPTDRMWHGHGLNGQDIGIEVSCRAAGITGDERTFWLSRKEIAAKKKYINLVSEATEIQLEATKELCRYYIALVKENGGEIKYIHAHRQAAAKNSDPGQRIWKEVAIPIMEEFGLTCGPVGWKIGKGVPIPQAWDEVNGKGVKYNHRVKGF